MIITVASGKGGTGKTTIATNLALSLGKVKLLDCDVEEPNSYLFIKPEIEKTYPVYIPVPKINPDKCRLCGRCQQVCAYNAIALVKNNVLVFDDLCHGCGACSYLCSEGAITEANKKIGVIEIGKKGNLDFIDGKLDIGKAMAPPIIREIKKQINPEEITIIDAPPGTSCPVIESAEGSDFVILVTEPTPFGLNDLKLAVETFRKLKIPLGAVINRSDLGDKKTLDYCNQENIEILLEIPFDKKIAASYSAGELIIEAQPKYKEKFIKLFTKIKKYERNRCN
ncbi:MAG: ATP-binding protein [Candidatus Omnitrophica bacterium]|nr:ATP-binding protein [Candidatus Omnitrophota bacterium]